MLAGVTLLTWLKTLYLFRVSETFGPIIKIITEMIKDVSKFMIIWLVIIVMFIAVGLLMFGEIHEFHSIGFVTVEYLRSALGEWDMDIYDGQNEFGHELVPP